MNRHPFAPVGDSPYCAYVRGVNDDAVCGEGERAEVHLSDDVEGDRFVPMQQTTPALHVEENKNSEKMQNTTPLANVEDVLAAETDGHAGLCPGFTAARRVSNEVGCFRDLAQEMHAAGIIEDVFLNTRSSDASKEFQKGLLAAARICTAKADSLRLAAEDGIREVFAEDIELCQELARRIAGNIQPQDASKGYVRTRPTVPLLQKIVEIADLGSAKEFGDADERLRAIRGLIIGEAV